MSKKQYLHTAVCFEADFTLHNAPNQKACMPEDSKGHDRKENRVYSDGCFSLATIMLTGVHYVIQATPRTADVFEAGPRTPGADQGIRLASTTSRPTHVRGLQSFCLSC